MVTKKRQEREETSVMFHVNQTIKLEVKKKGKKKETECFTSV
jgi:hypothetical protein